jgi:hypothetical protein
MNACLENGVAIVFEKKHLFREKTIPIENGSKFVI